VTEMDDVAWLSPIGIARYRMGPTGFASSPPASPNDRHKELGRLRNQALLGAPRGTYEIGGLRRFGIPVARGMGHVTLAYECGPPPPTGQNILYEQSALEHSLPAATCSQPSDVDRRARRVWMAMFCMPVMDNGLCDRHSRRWFDP
jgi:hypothetical protein